MMSQGDGQARSLAVPGSEDPKNNAFVAAEEIFTRRGSQGTPAPTSRRPPSPVAFCYTQSDSFVELLGQLRSTLVVSTYQANKLLALRASGQGLSTLVRTFDRPMGLAVDARQLAIGTRKEVWFLRNAPHIAPRMEPAGQHDACFLPRASHVTGDMGVHEIAWARDELWLVSTRFSCLATLDLNYSFAPRWRPPFITELAAEDRCHLNGLALVDDRPAYVTALGATDTRDGWRLGKSLGGCLIEMTSGHFVTQGLSMPHSPRWHDEKLWVLESGTGGLVLVDPSSGRRQTVLQLPGFTRGLAFAGRYAFIGLSKIRPSSAMDGVPLADRREALKCGIAAVNLETGTEVGLVEFQTAVEEIFDVQVLPEICFPEIIGLQKDEVLHTFALPPATEDPRRAGNGG